MNEMEKELEETNLEFAVGEEEGEQRLVCLNPPTVKLNKEQVIKKKEISYVY